MKTLQYFLKIQLFGLVLNRLINKQVTHIENRTKLN